MLPHSVLEVLLGIPNVRFVSQFAGYLIDHNRGSADAAVLAFLAGFEAWDLAVAFSFEEVQGLNTEVKFGGEGTLKDFSQVGEAAVGHQETEPLDLMLDS